jgi:formamidopyrimidine-DNA glycosylase
VPELPEVETARVVLERSALDREIAAVDDSDSYVCRPHPPGQIAEALVGRRLTAVHRRGKQLWLETSEAGPTVGIHLGMSGRILVSGAGDEGLDAGGDYAGDRVRDKDRDHQSLWDRFTVTYADGGTLRLFDPRRLGRVRLDPDVDALGPDAAELSVGQLRGILAASRAPVKARLLDQHAVAGVGNLLADEALWQAAVDPARPADRLRDDEVARLSRALRSAVRRAIRNGGVHTGEVVAHRKAGAHCPRCGAPMRRSTVGGRTTWSCSREQTGDSTGD